MSRILRQPSAIVSITLQRPMGIIFEEDARQKRAVISGFMAGSPAAQLSEVSRQPALPERLAEEDGVVHVVHASQLRWCLAAVDSRVLASQHITQSTQTSFVRLP